MRYIGIISTATDCRNAPFDWTEIMTNWGFPNFNLELNVTKSLVFRARMGDCPLLHVFTRINGGGVFKDIFKYNYETLTLDIKGYDPSHLGIQSFNVRAHCNNGVHPYRFEDHQMTVYIVSAPTVITFNPPAMVKPVWIGGSNQTFPLPGFTFTPTTS